MLATINGTEIAYSLEGEADAPVVVFSHSLATHSGMWDPQVTALRGSHRILRFDTRGHGASPVAPASGFDTLADDVAALLDTLGIDKVRYVGLSMGGMIGQALALRHPERLDRLVLCDTMARAPQRVSPSFEDRARIARQQGMEALVQPTLQRWFTKPFLDREEAAYAPIRDMIGTTPVEGFATLCGTISTLDYLDRLDEVSTPTLIIVGAEDVGTPVAMSQAMHERMPGSRLVIIDNASHLSNWEQPQAFNEALQSFLGNV